jgi:hypothetical protein
LPRPSSPVRAKASTVRPYFAWPDFLRPHSKARLSPERDRRTRRNTSGVLTFPSTLPTPVFSIKPGTGECFALSQPRTFAGSRLRELSSRRAMLESTLPRVTRRSKGGDPAAGSPTATLLRLRPSHRARLRRLPPRRVGSPTSGAPDFHGVTGGVYKARERIHRGVADPRLLAIPASRSRVADCDPNLDRVSPIRSPSRVCCGLSRPL